jgi:hypothetical protein
MLLAEHLGPFRQCRHQLLAALQVTQRSNVQPHVNYRRTKHYLKLHFFLFFTWVGRTHDGMHAQLDWRLLGLAMTVEFHKRVKVSLEK